MRTSLMLSTESSTKHTQRGPGPPTTKGRCVVIVCAAAKAQWIAILHAPTQAWGGGGVCVAVGGPVAAKDQATRGCGQGYTGHAHGDGGKRTRQVPRGGERPGSLAGLRFACECEGECAGAHASVQARGRGQGGDSPMSSHCRVMTSPLPSSRRAKSSNPTTSSAGTPQLHCPCVISPAMSIACRTSAPLLKVRIAPQHPAAPMPCAKMPARRHAHSSEIA